VSFPVLPAGHGALGMEVLAEEDDLASTGVTAADVLGLPVRVRGIDLGRSAELLVDLAQGRALGLEVLCGDGRNRFLPLSVAAAGDTELSLQSALVLVEDDDAAFYRRRAFRLGSLRGLPVERQGEPLGALRDVVFERDGEITGVVVESEQGAVRVQCSSGPKLGGGILRC
jgi:hypothetical protein